MKRFCLICTLSLCFVGCKNMGQQNELSDSGAYTESAVENTQTPSAAAEPLQFEAYTLEGQAVTDAIWTQKPLTMVNVWATYCGPCLQEMPDLGELARERQDIQIVGIVVDLWAIEEENETFQLANEIVAFTEADYLHIVPSVSLVPVLAGISVVPTTFFVDENGLLIGDAVYGAQDKAAWEEEINNRLVMIGGSETDA